MSFDSHHREESPLCAAGCGFFGSAENQGLCSKCYKDYLKKNMSRSESAILNRNRPDLAPPADQRQINTAPTELEIGILIGALNSLATAEIDSNNIPTVPAPAVAKKNRCELCRKKVGLLGFECRCGGTFCGAYRYAEAHPCKYDFKKAGKSAIEKENPVCEADKITDRI